MQSLGVGLSQGFLEAPKQQTKGNGSKHSQRQEGHAPAKCIRQDAANGCASAGDDAQTRQGLRHDGGALCRGVKVTHHRPCGHDACTHGHALQGAACDQPGHVGCEGAGNRGHHVSGHAPQQDGSATKAVRQGAPHQLRQAKGQQQCSQGELSLAHVGPKTFGDGGQGG